jgi:preprotein translocase SecF subunit
VIKLIEKDPEKLKPIQFMRYASLWLAISGVAIAIGFVFMYLNTQDPKIGGPLKLGIDYAGGNLLTGTTGVDVDSKDVFDIVKKYSSVEPVVQVINKAGQTRDIEIRTRIKVDPTVAASEQNIQRNENIAQMKKEIGDAFGGFTLKTQDYVGPVVGKELIRNAIISLILGSILIMIYIFIRFGDFVFATAAVLSLLHDVIIVVGGVAILRLEINAAFIAVILTIIGYSINDTIIIFDRIRENAKKYPMLEFTRMADISITQTIVRSIATVLTVVIMLLALLFFGGENIQDFTRALLIGIISGCYSSIYVAAAFVKIFRKKEIIRSATSVHDALAMADAAADAKAGKVAKVAPKRTATATPRQEQVTTTRVPQTNAIEGDSEPETDDSDTGSESYKSEKRAIKKKGQARRR